MRLSISNYLSTKQHIKKIVMCLFCIASLGCAQPKYEIKEGKSGESNSSSLQKAQCVYQLSNAALCLSWSWFQEPQAKKAGIIHVKTFRLSLLDQSAVVVDYPGELSVTLWMPSMGHGSVPSRVLKKDTGAYEVSNVFFVMPGDWEIKFQFKKENQIVDEVIISYTL